MFNDFNPGGRITPIQNKQTSKPSISRPPTNLGDTLPFDGQPALIFASERIGCFNAVRHGLGGEDLDLGHEPPTLGPNHGRFERAQ